MQKLISPNSWVTKIIAYITTSLHVQARKQIQKYLEYLQLYLNPLESKIVSLEFGIHKPHLIWLE